MDWNIALLIYVFTRLDPLLGASIFFSVLMGLGTVISLIIFGFNKGLDEDLSKAAEKPAKWFSIGLVCTTLFVALVPSQRDMAFIVAGSIGYEQSKKLVQSERMQRLGGKSLDAIEAWLDDVVENEGKGSNDES